MRNCLFSLLVAVLIMTSCSGVASVKDEVPAQSAVAGLTTAPTDTVDRLANVIEQPANVTEEPTEIADEPAEATAQATVTPSAAPTLWPTATPTAAPTATPTPKAAPTEVSVTQASAAPPVAVAQNAAVEAIVLTRIEDADPAPPLTIDVSAIRTLQNGYIRLTGTVRNDGSEAYGGIGVIATFYDREPKCYMGVDRQGNTVELCDPTYHGPVEVYAACSYLEPGATCPFSLEIYPRDYGSFRLHPEGSPLTYRQPASIAVNGLLVTNDGFGYLCISGTVVNPNLFPVTNARVGGALLDATGTILSVGSVPIVGEIAPGASAAFVLRIEYQPYATYRLYPEAVQG